jgi:hypothetical protein
MKITKLFVLVAALVAGATLVFAVPFQQYRSVGGPMNFYDNQPGAFADYNTMTAESPYIVIDGYREAIYMGPGGSTDPLAVLASGAATGDLYVGGAAYVTTVKGALSISSMQSFGESDATPDISGYSYFVTHATTDTITDFDGTTMATGQIIVVESAGAITYDVTTSGLVCGGTDVITADGDVTAWIYNGTDWLCWAFMDLDDNSNTWGAA